MEFANAMLDSRTPLLITATFDEGRTPHVALTGIKERVVKHMEGLIAWLKDPSIDRIVFVKNCGAKIRPAVLERFAGDYGKELEYLQVSSASQTVFRGKGYGEGDLIRQALQASKILRESDNFFKITGKLYSPDAPRLFTLQAEGEFFLGPAAEARDAWKIRTLLAPLYGSEAGSAALGVVRRYCRMPWGLIAAAPTGWVDTRFYRVRRDFYVDVLLRSYLRVQDALGYTLENAAYDDLKACNSISLIKEPPIIFGTSGTLGTTAGEFSDEIRTLAKELAERLII